MRFLISPLTGALAELNEIRHRIRLKSDKNIGHLLPQPDIDRFRAVYEIGVFSRWTVTRLARAPRYSTGLYVSRLDLQGVHCVRPMRRSRS